MSGKSKTGKPRKHPGVRGARPDRKAIRSALSAESLAAWRALKPAQQRAELDRRLGKGTGAKRQRARIARLERSAA